MIRANEIVPVATVNKTHGIHGELSVTVDPDIRLDVDSCVITPMEGIFTPFFISAIRPRTADTFLIRLDGVDSDSAAEQFVGAELYVKASDISDSNETDEGHGDDGFFAAALIGSTLTDTDGTVAGEITDIDTTTPNTLLIVRRPDGDTLLVPLASDLITSYDPEREILTMDIPSGLLDI